MSTTTRSRITALVTVLVVVAVNLALSAPPARAAGFTVTANRIDAGDGDTTDPVPDGCAPGDCSLREAVLAANAAPGADQITFAEPGTITLALTGRVVDADRDDLDVTDPLTILGPGVTVTTDFAAPTADTRILEHGSPLTLEGIRLLGARVEGAGGAVLTASTDLALHDVVIEGNTATQRGGGIATDDTTGVTIVDSLLADNAVVGDGALHGGAVHFAGADTAAALLVQTSTVEGNSVRIPVPIGGPPPTGTGVGGGLAVERGRLGITRTHLVDNTASGGASAGGAIWTQSRGVAVATIADSTIVGNTALSGAAFHGGASPGGQPGPLVVDRSLVHGNGSRTGAVVVDGRTQADITNTTFGQNVARETPAALHAIQDAAVRLTHVTVADNGGVPPQGTGPTIVPTDGFAGTSVVEQVRGASTQPVVLASTVLTHPRTGVDQPTVHDCAGNVVSADHNIDRDDTCNLVQPADLPLTPAELAALAPAGGIGIGDDGVEQTQTYAPTAGSPAVDSADPATCGPAPIDRDQRHVARPQGDGCERGAHERTTRPDPDPGCDPAVEDCGDIPPAGCDESDPGQADPAIPPGEITRVEGLNRIQTAITASQAICGDGQAPAVVLTRSDLFPDAQAGTPLAIALGAPLLLSTPDQLHPDTEEEIVRVAQPGTTVHLLGGTVALSQAVEDRLADLGYATVRHGGQNRFGTAAIIAGGPLGDPDHLLVADGGDFADSVVAGAASLAAGGGVAGDAAVLLTSGTDVPPETADYLAARDDDPQLTAVGADGAAAFGDVDAVVGPSRFETALAVADHFWPSGPGVVGIATADDFADALSGGAVVGRPDVGPGPILLTGGDDLPDSVEAWLVDHAGIVDTVVVFGGESAVSASVEAEIAAALGL